MPGIFVAGHYVNTCARRLWITAGVDVPASFSRLG
jgi:hypothetical protein